MSIKAVIFDVDGVLTDGSVYVDRDGNESYRFSKVDGHGIVLLKQRGFKLGVISTSTSPAARKRIERHEMDYIYFLKPGESKLKAYEEIKRKGKLADDQICVCGDDLPDLEILKKAECSCCPTNAQDEVKEVCTYISLKKGGEGFVRDVCNLLLAGKQ